MYLRANAKLSQLGFDPMMLMELAKDQGPAPIVGLFNALTELANSIWGKENPEQAALLKAQLEARLAKEQAAATMKTVLTVAGIGVLGVAAYFLFRRK